MSFCVLIYCEETTLSFTYCVLLRWCRGTSLWSDCFSQWRRFSAAKCFVCWSAEPESSCCVLCPIQVLWQKYSAFLTLMFPTFVSDTDLYAVFRKMNQQLVAVNLSDFNCILEFFENQLRYNKVSATSCVVQLFCTKCIYCMS